MIDYRKKVDDIKASKICGALLNLNILVPEIFLDFSPHEGAAREPRSGENTSREAARKKNELADSRLVFVASRKEEKSRNTSGTREEFQRE